jgi:hypothetical protein
VEILNAVGVSTTGQADNDNNDNNDEDDPDLDLVDIPLVQLKRDSTWMFTED